MKKSLLFKIFAFPLALLFCCFAFLLAACGGGEEDGGSSSDAGIAEVKALGFVDYDGVKLRGVAIGYGDRDLSGADVSEDTFSLSVYNPSAEEISGDGSVGDIIGVYVHNKAEFCEDKEGYTGAGGYVIIELFTDYTATSDLRYTQTMPVTVTQVEDIKLSNGEIVRASGSSVSNRLESNPRQYDMSIEYVDDFRLYTDLDSGYRRDGAAFHAEGCFDQRDGLYYDVDLSYALWLPEDYSSQGEYALVIVQNPAANADTLPLEAVLEYRSPAVYASDHIQELVKEEDGVDGLIVLVPVVTERVDDNGGTPAEYEAIVRLWDYIIDRYNVNENYIYGSGQSVGGMEILETNRNRDNFFAGMLLYDDQWGQNYYIDQIFSRGYTFNKNTAKLATMHYPRTNGDITWDYYLDSDGNEVEDDYDPYNYYFLVSDDNIMILNEEGGGMSNDTWGEMKYLYEDLAGYELNHKIVDGTQPLEDQSEEIEKYLGREGDELNINWISFSGVETSRKIDASYEWLVTQTRESETAREKLDLNKPFQTAETQIKTDERKLSFKLADGSEMYYKTGKSGAGTRGYNSCLLNTTSTADAEPGWLPEGMSWDVGVDFAEIESVTAIGSEAVAVKYDKDMSNLVVNIVGDEVYDPVNAEYRSDDFIVVDPFDFYDESGNKIEVEISEIYVNDKAETVAGRGRGEGSGYFVIVVFKNAVTKTPARVVQRTTLRTDTLFASASHKMKG